jgi:hypothetical protein
MARYADDLGAYAIAHERYERERSDYSQTLNAFRQAREHREAQIEQRRNESERRRRQAIADAMAQAQRMVPQAICWATRNPIGKLREYAGIMAGAQRVQTPPPLPDAVIPDIAPLESIPEQAPHMRAELEAMREEDGAQDVF